MTLSAATALSVGQIRNEVNGVLAQASPESLDALTACMSLEFVLKLSEQVRRGLSNSFQDIARKSVETARISDDECGDLVVVEDAWVLVVTKSGQALGKECA
jgi:hypothetical protein